MTDIFVLLIGPGGGDELQGVKRGIMEIADLILVNKADGNLRAAAEATRRDYAGALGLLRPRKGDPDGYPAALCVSAATGDGLEQAWEAIEALAAARAGSGARDRRRAAQAEQWFRHEFDRMLRDRVASRQDLAAEADRLSRAVARGDLTPTAAAAQLLAALLGED